MRKVICLLVASLLLLSGCTLPQGQEGIAEEKKIILPMPAL